MNTTTALVNFKKVQQIFSYMALLQLTDHLYPKQATVQNEAKYDFIIAGGGTAGCVIASRLVKRNATVLLIEAGGNPPVESALPPFFGYLPQSQYDYQFKSIKEDTMKFHTGGVSFITQGKMLGGSSGLNWMDYARGYPIDYNNWAIIANDSSWNYESVHPIILKSEKVIYEKLLNAAHDRGMFGTKGNMKLNKFYMNIMNKYFSAYNEMGIRYVIDFNKNHPFGITNILFQVGTKVRQNTAYSFLRYVKNYPNLHVLTHATVTKLKFDSNKNAVGVTVITQDLKTITVRARKEVIVAAGVFRTPQLLMLSGIGPSKHLESKNIKVIQDLPVGNNLQDRPMCYSVIKMGDRQPLPPLNPHKMQIPELDGYFALNGKQSYPDYNMVNLIMDDSEQILILCSVILGFTNKICDTLLNGLGDRQMFAVFNVLAYPSSRGEVRLRTKNIADQPEIKIGYYNVEKDLEVQARTMVQYYAIVNTTYFKSVGAEMVDPGFTACANLNKQCEEYWKCYCKRMITAAHYYGGTCAMGTVVDSKLLVKGVKRLRIADASIMPVNVASPPTAAVVMIAQRASNFIIKQHSL